MPFTIKAIENNAVLWLTLAILLALTGIYAADWVVALTRPYSIGYEGPIIWTCAHLASGHNIYPLSGLAKEPWIATIYPPLYFVIGALLTKLFGISFAPLRAISMLSLSFASVSMYRILRWYQCSRTVALISLTFFLSFGTVAAQSYMARTDMLETALSIAMIECFVRIFKAQSTPPESVRAYLPVLSLALLSLFAKQQAIVFVVTVAIFMVLSGARSTALKWSGLLVVAGTSLIWLLQWLTGGGFIQHMSFLSGLHSQPSILMSNLEALGLDNYKIILALILAPIGIFRTGKLTGLLSLPLLLLAVCIVTMSVSMGIPSSSENHAIPSIFALCWWTGVTLSRLPGFFKLLVALSSIITFSSTVQYALLEPLLMPYAKVSADLIKQQNWRGKPVLTDDPNINLLTGSTPVLVDCATFLNVWATNPESLKPLVDGIVSQRYASILVNQVDLFKPGSAWWPSPVVKAMRYSYTRRSSRIACSGWMMDWLMPRSDRTSPGARPSRSVDEIDGERKQDGINSLN